MSVILTKMSSLVFPILEMINCPVELPVIFPIFILFQTAISFWLYNGFQPGNKGWKKNLLFDRFNPLLGESKATETAAVNRNVGKSIARKRYFPMRRSLNYNSYDSNKYRDAQVSIPV